MNRAEATSLLRLRRELTGETFNDGTLDAWLRACASTDPHEAQHAMTEAARAGRVTLASFTERLPKHASAGDAVPVRCELCSGSGWVSAPPERAHRPEFCRPTEERPCNCHAAEPCRCSAGRQAEEVRRRIVEWNDRHRPPHLVEEQQPRRLAVEEQRPEPQALPL